MSSCPTALTSTTGSSTSSPSPSDPEVTQAAQVPALGDAVPADAVTTDPAERVRRHSPVGVIACGALADDVRRIAARRRWPVRVYPLPPLLHNRPERIAPAVAEQARSVRDRHRVLAVAYADCGSYGALDETCEALGLARLPGAHCYEVLAGAQKLAEIFAAEPGTYVLTDFLVRSFRRTVWQELGLDRYPQLRDDYFGHYRRVVWLAGRHAVGLRAVAEEAARMLGLPLTVVDVGDAGLEEALGTLITREGAVSWRS